jgi:AcrR family transcriptional regulator
MFECLHIEEQSIMGSSARPTQTEGTARRRGRRPASEVSGRSILLETAQRHFSRCGFGGTSLRAIARDADVTPALVCQLFGSKEGLYDALLEKLALDQQTQLAELVRLADLAERHAFERWVQMLVQIGPAISDVPALLMHEVDPMPEEHDNGESRIPRITEKLVRPFKRASMPILNKALEAGIIRGTSPDLVFSLLMGAVSATLLAPQISGESAAANRDFRERAAENLLLLVLK